MNQNNKNNNNELNQNNKNNNKELNQNQLNQNENQNKNQNNKELNQNKNQNNKELNQNKNKNNKELNQNKNQNNKNNNKENNNKELNQNENKNNKNNNNKQLNQNEKYYNILDDEEFKYMNYNIQKNIQNKFFEIYKQYIFYNELTLFTFFKHNDFNHKYLKLSLFVFYLECIILFNFIIFPNKIFSKIYKKKNYPFSCCLLYNFYVALISFFIAFGSKFFIGTQHDIFIRYEQNKETQILNTNNSKINLNVNNKEIDSKDDEKEIKKEKKEFINFEIKKKTFFLYLYFIGVLIVYIYSFIHAISFGIIFQNTQKYILINFIICYVIGIIFSLIFNLISCFLRFFGIKNQKEILFNLSLWLTAIFIKL